MLPSAIAQLICRLVLIITNSGKSLVMHVIIEYSDKWRKLWMIYFILDTKISEESIFRQVYLQLVYLFNKELSITMTIKFCMQSKEGYNHTVIKSIHLVQHHSKALHRWRNGLHPLLYQPNNKVLLFFILSCHDQNDLQKMSMFKPCLKLFSKK